MGGPTAGRLVVVRHGTTEWSRTGRHTSHSDPELEPAGRAAAEALGAVLCDEPFALVLTSPRRRAHETARLAGFPDAVVDEDLVEWDYGDYEGRTTEEIRAERPGWTLFADGAPGGERAAEVGRRADRVIELALATPGDTLCFAHGHLLRVLAARWIGLPPIGGRCLALEAGSFSVLGWEREVAVIASWNRTPPPSPPR
ncbi:MAG TPA: histidine phosphatase family protein [Acidimicrobiales bacterium]|nr:histidine phosphatase family protein [Acidimicrobiales bacterium]